MKVWPLIWSHGNGEVQALGGMLGPVNFELPSHRTVQPFAIFPWADESQPSHGQRLTGLMSRGRGEWPCVPFGLGPENNALGWNHPIHGNSAHGLWERIDDGARPSDITLRYCYPSDSPIMDVERHIHGVDGEAAVICRLRIRVRTACQLPVGIHPTLKMPSRSGALKLESGRFRFARSYPTAVEPGADVLESDQVFTSLSAARSVTGETVDLSAYPLTERTESLFQLCGVDGSVAVANAEEAYRFELSWNPLQFPSCLIWVSNAGRGAWPWSHRHYALGVEPVCSAFDLGIAASAGDNPISAAGVATTMELRPGIPMDIEYRMGVAEFLST